MTVKKKRSPKVTYEEAVAAFEAMQAQGIPLTDRNFVTFLGKGSFGSTLKKHYARWQKDCSMVPVALPSELKAAIERWASQEATQAAADTQEALASMKQERDEARREAECARDEATALRARVEEVQALAAVKEGTVHQLRLEIKAGREREAKEREQVEKLGHELARVQTRLEDVPRLKAELAQRDAMLNEERDRRQALDREKAQLQARLGAAERLTAEEKARAEAFLSQLLSSPQPATP